MLKTDRQVGKPSQRVTFRLTKILCLPHRQRGAVAVMTAALVLVILGFCGFALGLSMVYNRKVELQTLADTVALAAAAELDGTELGVDRAVVAAQAAATTYVMYDYNASVVAWSDSALRFSAAPSGREWLPSGAAKNQAQTMFYVEVDTSRLGAQHGRVNTFLLQLLPSASASTQTSSRAVAGRSSINVMPMAVCAMSTTRVAARGAELVEHGFRRGISYNLMRLNPDSAAKGANFLVNPVAVPGTTGSSVASKLNVIRPFVCTGTLAMPQITSGTITVEHDFPLGNVYSQINSRFGSYSSPCTSAGAPADTNVKEFNYLNPSTSTTDITWLVDKPKGQSADPRTTATKQLTIADLAQADIPPATTPDMFGPLWVYAKAARYSTAPEPAAGFPTFAPADWSTLYTPGSPTLKGSYPAPAPYKALTQSPPAGVRAVADRRVLNIPLLHCPVAAGSPASAEVLAIGRFYMTVSATATDLYGEFAGLAKPETLGGQVELYP